jgi:hypothetical protein
MTATILAAGFASADWNVYVAPGLGISSANVDTDGEETSVPVFLTGSDDDASPLLDFAVGLEVPMDELVAREWLLDVRLPNWPVRVELEAAGLREYELRTNTTGSDKFFTKLKATTLLVNYWLDIPLVSMYRPIQYTLGLGRQPRVRRWLEPASFYVGFGVGVGFLDFDATSNVLSADDKPIDFAWNVGAGFNYALTERVSLSAGYRFVGLGKHTLDLEGGPVQSDDIKFEPEVHEFRFAIRIRVHDFLSPWR